MSIRGCDRLVLNVVESQKKKFVVFLIYMTRSLLMLIICHRINGKDSCLNIYDVRLHDTWPACGMNWPPDIKPITDYLRVCSRSQKASYRILTVLNSAKMLLMPYMLAPTQKPGRSVAVLSTPHSGNIPKMPLSLSCQKSWPKYQFLYMLAIRT